MVILPIELDELGLEVGADSGKNWPELVKNARSEYIPAVFSDEDQVYMHQELAVSTVANLVVCAHSPNYNGGMERLQAYKYELMPDGEQARDMRRFSGACRYVYNKALALQMANHQAGHMFIGYVAMARQLTEWRNSKATPWLKDAPCHPLQHALKDLDRAYTNFFAKRTDFPRFKRKGCGDAFRYPDPKQIKFDQVNGNATVSLSGGKF